MLAACLAVIASPVWLDALLWLITLDAGVELDDRLELEALEKEELVTSALEELALSALVLAGLVGLLPLEEPPPHPVKAQALRK